MASEQDGGSDGVSQSQGSPSLPDDPVLPLAELLEEAEPHVARAARATLDNLTGLSKLHIKATNMELAAAANLNKMAAGKYAELVDSAQLLEALRQQCLAQHEAIKPQLEQIASLEAAIDTLEGAMERLDQASRMVELESVEVNR